MEGDQPQIFADLHIHTTASDGVYSPTDIVTMAKEAGLGLIAITDHDTVEGVEEAYSAAAKLGGIRVVAGVENSTKYEKWSIHLLAYFPGGVPPSFREMLQRKAAERRERLHRILTRLAENGINISAEEVERLADGVVGRPHIARVMVAHGIVASVQEAFDNWLGEGKPGYSSMPHVATTDMIKQVKEAGGMTSVAHPLESSMSLDEVTDMFKHLKEVGLDAVECYHSDHEPVDVADLLGIASSLGLAVSGGSDFHGIAGHHVVIGLSDRDNTQRLKVEVAEKLLGK